MNSQPEAGAAAQRQHRDTYHHGDLKRALIAAALELVAEKGPMGLNLTEAARRAGVSNAAPYRHFASRDDLLGVIAQQGFEELHDALAAVGAMADPVMRLAALCGAYVRWAVARPAHYQVMFGLKSKGFATGEWLTAGLQAFGLLIEAIRDGQAAGMLRGDDPRSVAAPTWALLHGLASLHIGGDLPAVGISEAIDDLTARAVAALLASPDISSGTAPGKAGDDTVRRPGG